MSDQSFLDKKYFIDNQIYNCPFCKRNNVLYKIDSYRGFNWSIEKKCIAIFVRCSSCDRISMHLSYDEIIEFKGFGPGNSFIYLFNVNGEIDEKIFYSVPTSFFCD